MIDEWKMALPRRAWWFLAPWLLTLALASLSCSDKDDVRVGEPTTGPPDPVVLTRSAGDRMAGLRSFHFVLEHENGGSPIALELSMRRAEGDMVPPDRMKVDVEAVAPRLGNINVKVQVIAVGDKAQVTNPFDRSQWVPLPGKNPLAEIFDPARGTAAAMRSVISPRIVGEEEIGGIAVWKVEGDIDAANLEAFASVADDGYIVHGVAWVGKQDLHVYRIRLEGPLGRRDEAKIVRKIELSKFDVPVSIELP